MLQTVWMVQEMGYEFSLELGMVKEHLSAEMMVVCIYYSLTRQNRGDYRSYIVYISVRSTKNINYKEI